MNTFKKPIHLFGLLWLIVNLLQAFFLDITHDEAYYFVWSEHMAWGFLDHPPVTPAMVKAGYTLLQNELGARLFFVFMTTASIFLLHDLIKPKNSLLFCLIIASVIPLHLAGFHALPDVPLLFFSISFLWLLKKYLEEDIWKWAVLLGINIALLLLSKYFGLLLIIFTLMAVPSLLKRKTFYAIAAIALLLFLPHWIWQHQHDYASLRFHLGERTANISHSVLDVGENVNFLLGPLRFIGVLLLFTGPFIAPLLFWASWKNKAKNNFDRIVAFMLWGTMAILLFQSFRGEIRVHWATVAIVPLVVKSIQYIDLHADRFRRWVLPLFWLTIIPLGFARMVMMYDFIPQNILRHDYYHGWDQWTKEFEEAAGDKPVVFLNSFPDASRFAFYSNRPTTSMNNVYHHRRNQFDFLEVDKELLGKDVLVCLRDDHPNMRKLYTSLGKKHRIVEIEHLAFFPRIKAKVGSFSNLGKEHTFTISPETVKVPLVITDNPYTKEELNINKQARPTISYHIFDKKGGLYCEETSALLVENLSTNKVVHFTINKPSLPGEYLIKIGIKTVDLPPTFLTDYRMDIE